MCHLPEAYNVPLHSLKKEEKEVLSALEDACVAANAAQIYVTLKLKLNPNPQLVSPRGLPRFMYLCFVYVFTLSHLSLCRRSLVIPLPPPPLNPLLKLMSISLVISRGLCSPTRCVCVCVCLCLCCACTHCVALHHHHHHHNHRHHYQNQQTRNPDINII